MPSGDEVAQCCYARVIGKLSQGIDCQQVGRLERYFTARVQRDRSLAAHVQFAGLLTADRSALSLAIIEESEWSAALAAPPL